MAGPKAKGDSGADAGNAKAGKDTSSAKDSKTAKDAKSEASGSNDTVHKIEDLKNDGVAVKVTPDASKLVWKINTSPSTVEDTNVLKKPLCQPLIKKADLQFPTGAAVVARNMKGVTIKDALDAVHKQMKKKEDDELPEPYLAGFYLDDDDKVPVFHIVLTKEGAPVGKKNKKKEAAAED